jgi:16S rRNA (cytosine967-C5)-methyltransferase
MAQLLRQCFVEGYACDKVLERAFREHRQWGAKDRRLIAEVFYDCVRWWRKLQWALGSETDPRFLEAALVLWISKTVRGSNSNSKVPADSSSGALKTQEWAGVLSRFSELDGNHSMVLLACQRFMGEATAWPVDQSLPDWLADVMASQVGAAPTQHLIRISNLEAPVFIRVNSLKATVDQVNRALADEEIPAQKVAADAMQITERRNVFKSKAFHSGLFEMQDLHSQRIAPFLQLKPGMRVVDGCAGAGGKTLHIGALMKNQGQIVALDVYEKKLAQLRLRVARAGVSCVTARLIDTTKVVKRLYDSADRVLLDVPCSGLGVLRRNPDTKWRLTPEELTRLNELQADILERYSRITKVGGVLVYSTCSVLPSENEQQVEKFLATNPGWRLDEQKLLWPEPNGGDGFFMARLVRTV